MKQKNQKRFANWARVILIGITLGLMVQFVRAWTEPTETPPGGNLGAPINTSSIWQTKWGKMFINNDLWQAGQQLVANWGLWVGGKVQADDFCLNSDTTKCLTNAGGGGGVPSGAVMFFNLGSCPSGWHSFGGANGRYIVGGGSIGTSVGQALGNGENRPAGAHTHNLGSSSLMQLWHNHTGNTGTPSPGGLPSSVVTGVQTQNLYIVQNASGQTGSYHNLVTGVNTGNTNHTHQIPQQTFSGILPTDQNNAPSGTNAPYIQLLPCEKD